MSGEVSQAIDPKVLWGGGRSPFSMSYGKMMMWFFLISDALTFGGLLTALGLHRHRHADIWPKSEDVFFHFPFVSHDTHLPLLYVAMMTFILIVSSVTMVLAVEAGHRMDKKKVIMWLALTVVGGFFFLGSQVWEWANFIKGSEHGALKIEQPVTLGDLRIPDGTVAQWADHSQTSLKLPWKDAETGEHVILSGDQAKEVISHGRVIYGANLHENEYGLTQYADFFFFVTGFHGFHVFSGVVINIIILIGVVMGTYHKRGHYEMVEKTGLYWHFVDLVWVFVFTFYYLL
ncbi:MAG: cytochrome c oxidase subunit 3 [Flavobacteriales bacterium]|nr:cytochrome c oxidase subunit 3 [Flavobacteriales bacterium]